MPGPAGYAERFIEAFERLEIRWALAGALAAERYRKDARMTTDVDFLVAWDPRLIDLVTELGFEARVKRDPGDDPHLIRARDETTFVDLLIGLTDYQKLALDRAAADNVLTVEDVLVHKIIAWRGRDRDDIESIVAAGHVIDWDYVTEWTTYFGFEDRIAKIER